MHPQSVVYIEPLRKHADMHMQKRTMVLSPASHGGTHSDANAALTTTPHLEAEPHAPVSANHAARCPSGFRQAKHAYDTGNFLAICGPSPCLH